VQVPADDVPADPTAITGERIEEAATALRRHWGLGDGPISNVLMLLENKGVLSTRYALEADTLDAFSVWDEHTDRPLMVLSADKGSAVRARFNAAHECGHLYIHRNVPRQLLTAPATFKLIEQQAHQFASSFLLPESAFARDHMPSGIAGWKALKEKWKVSIAALVHRAEELGMVSQNQARSLYANLARHGWRRQEPFDDVWQPENPLVVARSVQLVIDSGEVSKAEFLHAVGCDQSDVEQLAGLPERFFDDAPGADELEPGPKLLPFRHPPPRSGVGGQSAV
jgi:Zn-dependent peptidase ImmA (M78 family)